MAWQPTQFLEVAFHDGDGPWRLVHFDDAGDAELPVTNGEGWYVWL